MAYENGAFWIGALLNGLIKLVCRWRNELNFGIALERIPILFDVSCISRYVTKTHYLFLTTTNTAVGQEMERIKFSTYVDDHRGISWYLLINLELNGISGSPMNWVGSASTI